MAMPEETQAQLLEKHRMPRWFWSDSVVDKLIEGTLSRVEFTPAQAAKIIAHVASRIYTPSAEKRHCCCCCKAKED
jgi:hypothetical protein